MVDLIKGKETPRHPHLQKMTGLTGGLEINNNGLEVLSVI